MSPTSAAFPAPTVILTSHRHPDNELIPGVLIFRVEAPLLYFNVDHVQHTVLERVRSRPEGLHVVICDLSNTPYLDVAGTRMLAHLYNELKLMNIELLVVEAHATERDILRAEGLDKLVGPIHRETSLVDALADLKIETPQKTL